MNKKFTTTNCSLGVLADTSCPSCKRTAWQGILLLWPVLATEFCGVQHVTSQEKKELAASNCSLNYFERMQSSANGSPFFRRDCLVGCNASARHCSQEKGKRRQSDAELFPRAIPAGHGGWVKNLSMLCDSLLSNAL